METRQANFKRKKKRSIVQTVKKKFKKNFRNVSGTKLDSDIHEYFLRVFQQSKHEFESQDDRSIFINNVFSQTEGHEVEYSTNQLVSRIIENFLPECSDEVLQRFFIAFTQNLRPVCSHQFASHVLETLLRIASKYVFQVGSETNAMNDPDMHVVKCREFTLIVSKFLLNNIDEFILDKYANYITRTAINCLGGSYENKEEIKKNESKFKKKDLNDIQLNLPTVSDNKFYPKEFKSLLHQFGERILNSHMFTEYARNISLSGLIQVMLRSLHFAKDKKYLQSITIKLLDVIYCPDRKDFNIVELLKNQEAVYLLDVMLMTSTDKIFIEIWQRCFKTKLSELAISKTANYSVQKLIERCTTDTEFELIYDELNGCFGQIVGDGYSGVLFALSKMCCKLQSKQKEFIKDIMKAVGYDKKYGICGENLGFVCYLLLLHKCPLENISIDFKNEVINLHGCLIIQEMLKFNKPKKVVKSILAMDTQLLVQVFCDQKGSHIADAFFSNSMKSKKYQGVLTDKLKENYCDLAVNMSGSFVLTAMWQNASVDQKLIIVKELCCKESFLRSSKCGKYVAIMTNLETFRHQPQEWEKAQKQLINTRQIFSDVIGKNNEN